MTTTASLGILLLSLALALAAFAVLTAGDPVRRLSVANLRRDIDPRAAAAEDRQARGRLAALGRRLTPAPAVRLLERAHARAGRPATWPVDRLLTLKALWVPVGTIVVLLLVVSGAQALALGTGLAVSVVVYFLPDLLLHSRGQERAEKIQLELADTLDQMTIAVEAGLGFDAAMARAAHNGKGPLAEELTRTLQDIQMGQARRQAFEALSRRANVPDLRRFVRAITQADAYGISIADVLRTQAGEMRLKRRQRAEEKAQQVPVKVLMPLMLCILPVLFIVVMGPAALNMVDAFGG